MTGQDRQLIIQTQNLAKKYGQVSAVQSLNLEVPKNSIFGFLGPNGAGKTTTMKLLLGLIHPTSGTAKVFGSDIQKESVSIRKRIGYLPQQPRFIQHMTAREILRFTARFFFHGPKPLLEERIDEMLELVGLQDKANRTIKGFSGGERQRLGIAQAQINFPDLLILDEPAAALDPVGRMKVLEIMENLRKQTTVFYSTHILDDVQRVSDTVAILDQGKLVAQGPIEGLLDDGSNPVFDVKTKGIPDQFGEQLSKLEWVSNIHCLADNGHLHWQVSVSDEKAAEEQLLRLMLNNPKATVLEFNRKKYELEEIFIHLVRGETK